MRRWLVFPFILLCPLVCSAEPDTLPPFQTVEQLVSSYFGGLKDYRANDLLARDHVKSLLEEIARAGWKVADADDILADVLSERDPLVKRLRTKAGKKFMRQAGNYPLAYDRMDHL